MFIYFTRRLWVFITNLHLAVFRSSDLPDGGGGRLLVCRHVGNVTGSVLGVDADVVVPVLLVQPDPHAQVGVEVKAGDGVGVVDVDLVVQVDDEIFGVLVVVQATKYLKELHG